MLGKINVFQPLEPPQIIQFAARNEDETDRSETRNFIDFQRILASEINPNSDGKESVLGRYANHPELSQPRSFWTIYLAIHMIRSGIYIYIYIDLLLVALIISVGCSEGHVTRRLQQA